ncbi:NfeD family protein [[Mycoplasma] collis]|uniref:NfeD family protein n=1 Tax=[Mycoplasma] collis TaxID=2127 RepID=UPI00051AE8F1|nr:NfeD family protein [[Mycoplasma] collis]
MNLFQSNLILKYVFLAIFILIIISLFLAEILNPGFWIGVSTIGFFVALIIVSATEGEIIYIVISWAIAILIDALSYLIFWFFFRKYFVFKKKKNKEISKDNIGFFKETTLLEDSYEVNNQENKYGKVVYDDKTFLTLSIKGEGKISKGEVVQIEYIDGNILFVKKSKK